MLLLAACGDQSSEPGNAIDPSGETAELGSHTALVTSGADAGPGSFRTAIERANTNPSIRSIGFAPRLAVTLTSAVVFTGRQDLYLNGRHATITAASCDECQGFVATGGGDLAIGKTDDGIQFEESGAGDLKATFVRSTITNNARRGINAEQADEGGIHRPAGYHDRREPRRRRRRRRGGSETISPTLNGCGTTSRASLAARQGSPWRHVHSL